MKTNKSGLSVLLAALLVVGMVTAVYGAEKHLTVATASMGGAFYPIGNGIAEVVNKHVPGLKVTAEVTGGSTENPRLVGSAQSDIGICNANHAYEAREGVPPFQQKFDVVAIGALHGSVLHIVTIEKTGVKTVSDLKGKRIAAGPAGGGSVPVLKAVLSVFDDVKFEDLKCSYVSYSDGVTSLKDGNAAAALVTAGVPAAAVMELGVTDKVKFVSIPDDKLDALTKKYPYYNVVHIPTSLYKTDKDEKVVGVNNLLIVNSKMDEKTAYDITKAIYSHLEELATYHASIKEVKLEQAAKVAGVPLHPGAVKFFKEKGLIK